MPFSMLRLVVVLIALGGCGFYRDISPKSDRNLAFDRDRPEREYEKLYMVGKLLKVINFEGTDKQYVYVPLNIKLILEKGDTLVSLLTPTDFSIRKRKENGSWEEVEGDDYLLLDNHRYLEEHKSISARKSWGQYYRKKWDDAREHGVSDTVFAQLKALQKTYQETCPETYQEDDPDVAEIGLLLVCEKKLFEIDAEYQFDFTPAHQGGDEKQRQTISYKLIVDHNNAILGFGLGLLIVGVALGVS